jgi:hypothetical protein
MRRRPWGHGNRRQLPFSETGGVKDLAWRSTPLVATLPKLLDNWQQRSIYNRLLNILLEGRNFSSGVPLLQGLSKAPIYLEGSS